MSISLKFLDVYLQKISMARNAIFQVLNSEAWVSCLNMGRFFMVWNHLSLGLKLAQSCWLNFNQSWHIWATAS